jgi:cytochrome c-type biogenesis protein CcmH/NrfG
LKLQDGAFGVHYATVFVTPLQKLLQLLERQNAEFTVIRKELKEQRAKLQRRNTYKKGKRVRLQGEFAFSTADVLKIAAEEKCKT